MLPSLDPSRKATGNRALAILALAALFAVVLSTISMPSDSASAQVADASTDVEKRAAAWWGVLTAEERVNVLLGNTFDGDSQKDGRQLDDGDPDTLDVGGRSQRNYDQLIAVDKTAVNYRVDGSHGGSDPYDDIYAVGNHFGGGIQGIRALQSVKLWWNHLSCGEARVAAGEDFNAPSDDFDHDGVTTNDNILEPSSVCKFSSDADVGGGTDNAELIPYDSLGATAKTQANEVGNALLGLTNGGTYSKDDNAIAQRWWDALSALHRARALYGDGITSITDPTANADNTAVSAGRAWIASQDYADITTELTFTVDISGTDTELPLDDDSKALVPEVKALINDRAMIIYGSGGSGGKYEGVDAWWNARSCLEQQIAVGEDNEPGTAGTDFCNDLADLADDQDRNGGPPRTVSNRERAMTVGRALLDLADIPGVAAWWDTLNNDQRVNVVYGDDDTAASEADRKAFQKMYADLGTGYVVVFNVPSVTTALLTRHGVPTTDFDDDGDDTNSDVPGYAVKAVVDTIATEIFDPPHSLPGAFRRTGNSEIVDKDDNSILTNVTNNQPADDDEFDPPYQSVADWWENLDCRTMRLAVGEDNDYLAVDTDTLMTGYQNETSAGGYCGHLPGADAATATNTVSADVQTRIETVGKALLARSEIGRPSFNEEVVGAPTISGEAYVGSVLTANTGGISDEDGTGTYSYQWMRTTNPTVEIAGATSKTYTVQVADIGAMLSVRVSYTDGERYPESTTSALTNVVAGSLGKISKIEPSIRGVTVSGGDVVALMVNIYGVQGDMDNTLGGTISWSVDGTSIEGSGRELVYTAPSSPATYMVKATLDEGDCRPKDEADRATACSAEFEVKVRRPAAAQPAPEAPVNPPGEIPSIIADSDGNQYEVFTPVEGGTFTGEGVTVSAEPGAVPNDEIIGVRAEAGDMASNAGQTHHRVTLDGRYYTVAATDASGEPVNAYRLDDPVTVCIPLPARLAANISDVTIVSMRDDGTFAILASQVKLTASGTTLCGQLSELSATVAAAHIGSPAALPTPTPEPTPETPDTGGTSPTSSGILLWTLLLGIAALTLGTALAIARRRHTKH